MAWDDSKSRYSKNKNDKTDRREKDYIDENIIQGRNAIIEAIKSGKTIESILIAKGEREGNINVIYALAKEKDIVIKEVDKRKLDALCGQGSHQGVVAKTTPYSYCELEDILKVAEEKGEDPFIIILDEIEDPHNMGSIIRSAEIFGAHGIVIPKRRNVGVTPSVYKSSVGAVEYIKIAKVTNVNSAIDNLKSKGIWVYGCHMEGSVSSDKVNLNGPVALVVGNEGKGISRLTKEKCDVLVKIPMAGKINSLNASVAAGIMMYEVLKSRLK
ncbi:23S rRNA (guanosine(2251)-2'-O)-methyltransferase RlmB [Clostridium oryzae]|uniref:Putative TrmH family tRNA/rRNA methyltransferase n=1 Tax=Clostridium oryzae TaxID=1450648 RepID=A0A1V4IKQ8_9CLOT|nr:23S rRNA (guanosine(2251)-2'-O)-methyltransferase RlmB [Clostridium oryzae]OPJ60611.1 putative TrmH family tRNA/rRNA methyltransferase [Clostridium oryzae]